MHKQKQQEKDEVQIHKFWQMFKKLHINITLADALILIPKYQKMLKALLLTKEKLLELANTPLNENCLAVILKKLPEKLRDPGKFLIPRGFSKLNTTSSSPNHLLEEFANELALITFLPGNDDLSFDIESDLKEIEYLLPQHPIKDMDSILEDSIDQSNLANLNDNLSKLLIDELDLPSDFLPLSEYDSFLSEDFSKVDALHSTNNEDKNAKKLAISHASLILEDFDLPLSELPSFKEVPGAETPHSFSSENEENVFKIGIDTSKEVHSFLILELSHQGCNVFKINQIFKSPIKIFLFSYGENIHILDVPCLYFYPP
uniref:Reverse transcriptase domain-containing protein n=1 Tax=Tanacetum cinerariifolium TaxID=118510 RepID=A0A699KD33_TANCI|nr:reverse transcriptase domain-containing protein [Tanacetum cinerariifolium]